MNSDMEGISTSIDGFDSAWDSDESFPRNSGIAEDGFWCFSLDMSPQQRRIFLLAIVVALVLMLTLTLFLAVLLVPTHRNNNFKMMKKNLEIVPSGSKSYMCSGSCYCNEELRKTGPATITLSILISAVSVSTATNTANHALKTNCITTFISEPCKSEQVSHEIEECEYVKDELLLFDETEDDEMKSEETEILTCEGRCVRKWRDRKYGKLAKSEYDCNSILELEETVFVKRSSHQEHEARMIFASQHLDKYCRGESTEKCVGYMRGMKDGMRLKNVSCRKE